MSAKKKTAKKVAKKPATPKRPARRKVVRKKTEPTPINVPTFTPFMTKIECVEIVKEALEAHFAGPKLEDEVEKLREEFAQQLVQKLAEMPDEHEVESLVKDARTSGFMWGVGASALFAVLLCLLIWAIFNYN